MSADTSHDPGEHIEPDGASNEGIGAEPLRCCLVGGERLPKAQLLRFVVDPANRLVFDPSERLPGRGLWLKAERDMIQTATSKRLFSKAARQTVEVPEDLESLVVAGLKRRCLDRLGLARRAGLVALGFEQVRAHVKAGRAGLLLEASDGSPDSRRKMTEIGPDVPVIDVFTGFELGRALGRDHVVHVALSADKLTDVLRSDCNRLRGVGSASRQN